MSTTVKYPNVTAKLLGQDGNAFVILGIVQGAMRRANVPKSEQDAFIEEATAGDYDELLVTCMKWVNVK